MKTISVCIDLDRYRQKDLQMEFLTGPVIHESMKDAKRLFQTVEVATEELEIYADDFLLEHFKPCENFF
jgi:hypothetical protein